MTAQTDLYAPFEPRFVRYVGWVSVVVLLGGLVLVLVAAPGTQGAGYARGDAVGITTLVVVACLVLWRQATVRATVDAEGITVRNLARVRSFDWAQVLAVSYGSGDPWVMLELSDGTRWPMMAVQRSDGRYADRQARRLLDLVALHAHADPER